MSRQYQLFATTPKGLELLLVDELRALGAKDPREKLAGVSFQGDLTLAYKACLWSRLANRILLSLASVPADTPDELYRGVQSIAWDEHIDAKATLAVHFVSSNSNITHTLFGAQKVKDAIVDQLREKYGVRPSVAKEEPDVSVYVYLQRDVAAISIDLSGESLHKRGYRLSQVTAPLKENLAAAILKRCNWENIAKDNGTLMDPMCGSGTLLIEGALMAADIAPGIMREYFGFLGWKQHQPALWRKLWDEANARREAGIARLPQIIGYDEDAEAIKSAFENIERAGLRGKIHVEKRDLFEFTPMTKLQPGLVVTNPPYGERLGEVEEIKPLYTDLGNRLKLAFTGWKAGVITGNPDLGKQMGLRSKKQYAFFNGAIPSQLLLFDVEPQNFVDRSPEADNARRVRAAQRAVSESQQAAIEMFANRIKKNLKHIARQAKREDKTSYRIYDADLPDYAFAIDVDGDKIYVREYEAPKNIDIKKVERRRQEVLAVLPELLSVDPGVIYFEVISE
ncbi:MAG TPA: bifunctional 23S rRNA (guanine(2069)-N(7))-methyltransferase RlmK/23S rRNA (guanine(2445)-N(2))-methyltransferase RlmL [Gammaproteobacteria bacterium]|nr:bifunctional 23S rRNA (guanine(2069)-N(7))-methyltransferase RlmK/23S rRNA (guanine(2445)-N(2))-methyltransferase RlmL [Gammaproteobacteria bacterium]